MKELLAGDLIFKKNSGGEKDCSTYFFYIDNNNIFKWSEKFELKKIKLSQLKKQNLIVQRYEGSNVEWQKKLINFFFYHNYDRRLMSSMIGSIFCESTTKLKDDFPRLIPKFHDLGAIEYNNRWEKLLKISKPGNLIFTFDETSIISKIIAKVTRGPWSHVGIIFNEKMLSEAVTSGVIERPMEVYRDGKTRVGLYRKVRVLTEEEIFKMHEAFKILEIKQSKYNYKGAVLAGIYNLLKIKAKMKAPTPMDLLYKGEFRLIHYI